MSLRDGNAGLHEVPSQFLNGVTATSWAYCLLFGTSVSLRANFGWRHAIGQVLFNLEPNRRLVSANASD